MLLIKIFIAVFVTILIFMLFATSNFSNIPSHTIYVREQIDVGRYDYIEMTTHKIVTNITNKRCHYSDVNNKMFICFGYNEHNRLIITCRIMLDIQKCWSIERY